MAGLRLLIVASIMAAPLSVSVAGAACLSGTLAEWSATRALGWETSYNQQYFYSYPGSNLAICGKLTSTCGPMSGVHANADSELTWVVDGLVSLGGSDSLDQHHSSSMTHYAGGSLRIYQGSPKNTPTFGSEPPSPPNATVPSTYEDGTLLYQASISNFTVLLSRDNLGNVSGGWSGQFTASGGVLRDSIPSGEFANGWFPVTFGNCGAPIAGYVVYCCSGSFSYNATVPVISKSWGDLKTLYR